MITAGHLLVAGAFRGTGWALPLAVDVHVGMHVICGSKFVGDGCKTRRRIGAANFLVRRTRVHHLSPLTTAGRVARPPTRLPTIKLGPRYLLVPTPLAPQGNVCLKYSW